MEYTKKIGETISIFMRTAILTLTMVLGISLSSGAGWAAPVPSPSPAPIYFGVNCGGEKYTDHRGRVFQADRQYSTPGSWGYLNGHPSRTEREISGTTDNPLYQTDRWGVTHYRFDLPEGVYRVGLEFAEVHFKDPARRIFDVEIEGWKVLDNLDIFSSSGPDQALSFQFLTRVEDGSLDITARSRRDQPKFCAIFIEQLIGDENPPPVPSDLNAIGRDSSVAVFWTGSTSPDIWGYRLERRTAPKKEFTSLIAGEIRIPEYKDSGVVNGITYYYRIRAVDLFDNVSKPSRAVEISPRKFTAVELATRINCGGEEQPVPGGPVYLQDKPYSLRTGGGYLGGAAISLPPPSGAETVDLLQTAREGVDEYRFDLPPGLYRINLQFAEPAIGPGDRLFDVVIEGRTVREDLDIAHSGGTLRVPLKLEYLTRLTGGELNIAFSPRLGKSLISSLTVQPASPDKVPPAPPVGLKTHARDRRIFLTWEENREPDLAGYHIYEAVDNPEKFIRLTGTPVLNAGFKAAPRQDGVTYYYRISAVDASGNESSPGSFARATPHTLSRDEFLEVVEKAAFFYFWEEAHPKTGLIWDKAGQPVASTGAIGFGLPALCAAAERGWVPAPAAEARAWRILSTLNAISENKKYGIFYHYLKGDGSPTEEGYEHVVSTVDTAIMLAGAVVAGEYFGGRVKTEAELMVERADWKPFLNPVDWVSMGFQPADPADPTGEGEMIFYSWDYYSGESVLVSLFGISAPRPEYRLPARIFYRWSRYRDHYGDGADFVYSWSGALFTYNFAHCFLDFQRLGPDDPSHAGEDGPAIDWWRNSIAATRANRQYCIDHRNEYPNFGVDSWGLTACSGDGVYLVPGTPPRGERGADPGDGTIAPYGAGSSIPFLPRESLAALRYYYNIEEGGEKLVWVDEFEGGYGFRDSFNLPTGFFSEEYMGIDQGPMLMMIENYRSGLFWKLFLRNKQIRAGLKRIGFRRIPE